MSEGTRGSELTSIFDGATLAGWRVEPRVYGTVHPGGPLLADVLDDLGIRTPPDPQDHPARWLVEEGVLIGEQANPGYGGYLVSERAYGDFELSVEVRPDFPADTGIVVRRPAGRWEGFQLLLDHRESGGMGGFFGNGLASFAAVPFAVSAVRDDDGTVIGLTEDNPAHSSEPVTDEKRRMLSYAASAQDFLDVWRFGEWNHVRLRCVGHLPILTSWINGVKIAELVTAMITAPGYDAAAVANILGARGHIALEVHDNDSQFGDERWAPGARCRWRDLRIGELDADVR